MLCVKLSFMFQFFMPDNNKKNIISYIVLLVSSGCFSIDNVIESMNPHRESITSPYFTQRYKEVINNEYEKPIEENVDQSVVSKLYHTEDKALKKEFVNNVASDSGLIFSQDFNQRYNQIINNEYKKPIEESQNQSVLGELFNLQYLSLEPVKYLNLEESIRFLQTLLESKSELELSKFAIEIMHDNYWIGKHIDGIISYKLFNNFESYVRKVLRVKGIQKIKINDSTTIEVDNYALPIKELTLSDEMFDYVNLEELKSRFYNIERLHIIQTRKLNNPRRDNITREEFLIKSVDCFPKLKKINLELSLRSQEDSGLRFIRNFISSFELEELSIQNMRTSSLAWISSLSRSISKLEIYNARWGRQLVFPNLKDFNNLKYLKIQENIISLEVESLPKSLETLEIMYKHANLNFISSRNLDYILDFSNFIKLKTLNMIVHDNSNCEFRVRIPDGLYQLRCPEYYRIIKTPKSVKKVDILSNNINNPVLSDLSNVKNLTLREFSKYGSLMKEKSGSNKLNLRSVKELKLSKIKHCTDINAFFQYSDLGEKLDVLEIDHTCCSALNVYNDIVVKKLFINSGTQYRHPDLRNIASKFRKVKTCIIRNLVIDNQLDIDSILEANYDYIKVYCLQINMNIPSASLIPLFQKIKFVRKLLVPLNFSSRRGNYNGLIDWSKGLLDSFAKLDVKEILALNYSHTGGFAIIDEDVFKFISYFPKLEEVSVIGDSLCSYDGLEYLGLCRNLKKIRLTFEYLTMNDESPLWLKFLPKKTQLEIYPSGTDGALLRKLENALLSNEITYRPFPKVIDDVYYYYFRLINPNS